MLVIYLGSCDGSLHLPPHSGHDIVEHVTDLVQLIKTVVLGQNLCKTAQLRHASSLSRQLRRHVPCEDDHSCSVASAQGLRDKVWERTKKALRQLADLQTVQHRVQAGNLRLLGHRRIVQELLELRALHCSVIHLHTPEAR